MTRASGIAHRPQARAGGAGRSRPPTAVGGVADPLEDRARSRPVADPTRPGETTGGTVRA